MTEALAYLAAAVLCVPLAKRLGLGSVLGYLIAGALIGPWGFGFIQNIDSAQHLAEFGVVLMLFVIGLELEPKRLMAMKRDVFGGGTLQVALCGALLMGGLLAMGWGWKGALVAGFALALSSTAIAVATMNERNFMPTPTGQTAFSILLFQDIAAIPLLAIVPLLGVAAAASSEPGWMGAAKAFGAIAAVIVIGRYLTRPLLRVIAATGLREVFTAFALLLVIGIAELMVLSGLSMGLGAFLAGVLLAGSEYRHALETDIEPFKGLLLGLFFIAVGMAIDFGLLINAPVKVIVLVLAYLVVKVVALWGVARVMGVSHRQRLLFAFLISQGGEFAFVVFGAARMAGVLDPAAAGLLTLVVALSMATTPLLLIAHDAWMARAECAQGGKPDPDVIDEKDAPVIIAGFGRFGQIVGRLLIANGVRTVVLDHDPDQIEMLRRFGNKVFYGDATRLDLIEAAGAKEARLLVNAIDDVEDNLALTDLVREHFPNLKIVARARNVSHYVQLKQRGIDIVERESFEAALNAGRRALEALGHEPYRAAEMANLFRRHNIKNLDAMVPAFADEERLVSVAKAGREELEAQFARDRAEFEHLHPGRGWAPEAEREAAPAADREAAAGGEVPAERQ
ncbi:MAG: glutathione-regulated potassium-efflux system protein KefC [Betaproteobacteria bacterium]|nr:glutathione-regulated potassium-efflux system protein KefC [Betaproteobacteria bacterium]